MQVLVPYKHYISSTNCCTAVLNSTVLYEYCRSTRCVGSVVELMVCKCTRIKNRLCVFLIMKYYKY